MRGLLDLGNDQKSDITRSKSLDVEYYGDSIKLMQADLFRHFPLRLMPQAGSELSLGRLFPVST